MRKDRDSERAPPGPDRLSAVGKASALAVVCVAVARLLLELMPGGGVALYEAPSWMAAAVLVGFVASEPLVFHVETRNESVSFGPSDIPLAIGLLLLPVPLLLTVRILGSALALAWWRRQPLFKLSLNLGAFAVEATLAAVVLRLVIGAVGDDGPMLWFALVVALMVGLVCGGVLIAVAISFFEGDVVTRVGHELSHVYLFYLPGAMLGATTAAPFVVAPWLVAVYLLPTAVLWVVLRSLGTLRHRFFDLNKIHAFSNRVGGSAGLADIADTAVGEISEHLRADSVALVVYGPEARAVEAYVGDRRVLDRLPWRRGDDRWEEIITSPFPLATANGTGHGIDETDLARVQVRPDDRELLVVLGGPERVLGLMVVSDRRGALAEFDDHDVERLRPLGQQLAVALRKGELHEQVQHEALHDPLTGAPNRAYFDAWSRQWLAQRGDAPAAFIMIDLDRFKEVNDTLGHAAGDELLIEVCRRLHDALGPRAVVARLGGDEFAVALPEVDAAGTGEVVERLSEQLEQPIDLASMQVAIGGSIGIAMVPDDGTDVSTLMRRADMAMYDAKGRHERAVRWRQELETEGADQLGLLGDFRQALAQETLDVAYQPKIDFGNGRTVGAEALVRWHHPTHGDVPTDVFVTLAEKSGLIGPMTEVVLARALAAARMWLDAGHTIDIAVNISALSFVLDEFPRTVQQALEVADVPAEMLVLEVTERAMVGESQRTREVLLELDRLGVRLSVDDFGTGYSSLLTLRTMPVSELKIDQRFVGGLADGGSDEIIVHSTIRLAHSLGLTVVAEGVESATTVRLLREAGCDVGQGFGMCRPTDARGVLALLEHTTESV